MLRSRSVARSDDPQAGLRGPSTLQLCGWLLLLAMHVPLAMTMHKSPFLATIHAYITLVALLIIAVCRSEAITVLMGAFYLMGSELLWRMCGAAIPWEVGKYAAAMLFGLHAFRSPRRRVLWPWFYFLLLIPSTLGVLFEYPFAESRKMLSFTLSGQLAIVACLFWCSNRKLPWSNIHRVFLTALMPLTGVMAVALSATFKPGVVFGTEANFATSGGFGPNQVSALLGLAAAFCFCLISSGQIKKWILSLVLAGLMGLFLMQSMMTFSRTGLYLAGGFILAASLLLLQTRRARFYLLLGAVIFCSLGWFVVFSRLDEYTGGKLAARYVEINTSNRKEILQEEIQIFLDNPILGVGPAGAKFARQDYSRFASHSEPSRMLAEHGLFGMCAMLFLFWKTFQAFLQSRPSLARAFSAGAAVWTLGFVFVSALRLVAPAVVLGMVFLLWVDPSELSKRDDTTPSR